jgi:hypothetical protein
MYVLRKLEGVVVWQGPFCRVDVNHLGKLDGDRSWPTAQRESYKKRRLIPRLWVCYCTVILDLLASGNLVFR